MKSTLSAAVLGFVFFYAILGVSTAIAATVNERQDRQSQRIEQGVKSGELNRKEATRLAKQQALIAKKEAYFKSDGSFTKKERAVIQKNLANTSHNIYQQKHDAQSR